MSSIIALLLVSLVATGLGSNSSRYKIILSQEGYTQFIQYDVATPPLREITMCLWIKLYHTQGPQSILTYLAKGNNRIVKIWLDEDARYLMLTIKGYAMPKVLIHLGPNIWNHFCFSYQSAYGAYALYLNGHLLQCEATEKLIGYAFPSGGSIIIGYGITLEGKPIGLSGEIYGVNMIVASTIKVNDTLDTNRFKKQNSVDKKIVSNHNTHIKYVVLSELKDNETDMHYLQSKSEPQVDPKIFPNHKYLRDFLESLEATDLQLSKDNSKYFNKEMSKTDKNEKHTKHFKPKNIEGSFLKLPSKENHFGSTDTLATSFQEAPISLLQYEVPPPLSMPPRTTKRPSGFRKQENAFKEHLNKNLEYSPEHIFPPAHPTNMQIPSLDDHKIFHFPVTTTAINSELAQHIVPPPLPPDSFKTNSKDDVKKNKVSKSNKKKIKKKSTKQIFSDVQTREISEYEVPPPPDTDTNVYGQWTAFTHNGKISDFLKHMRYDYRKVPTTIPLITVSETFPYPAYKIGVNVVPNNINRRIFYKREAIRPEINVKIINEHDIKTTILNEHSKIKVKSVDITHRGAVDQKSEDQPANTQSSTFDNYDDDTIIRERPLLVELPFIKALEYYETDLRPKNKSSYKDINYTQTKKGGLNYSVKEQVLKTDNQNDSDSSWGQPTEYTKYVFKQKVVDGLATQLDLNASTDMHESNFHRHVKLGNALNERFVIGKNVEQKKRSFEGGDELVPEINRYRSDIDKVFDRVPNSLMPKVCRNIDMLDLSSHNVERHKYSFASEFVLHSLKHDFLDYFKIKYDTLLYINWQQTPVRLFGGAMPVKEQDICSIIKCDSDLVSIK